MPARYKLPIPKPETILNRYEGEIRLPFAVCSDNHSSDRNSAWPELYDFYDRGHDSGVRQYFNCGDIVAGHRVYRGQENDLEDIGFQAQKDRMVRDYPSPPKHEADTKFILGNHGLSFYTYAGADIGEAIDKERSDLKYLGPWNAHIKDGDISLMMTHQRKASGVSQSYQPQKYIDRMLQELKPTIMMNGHRHQAMFFKYGGVNILEAGHFQYPTSYATGAGFMSNPCGWIIDMEIKKTKKKGIKREVLGINAEKIEYKGWLDRKYKPKKLI